MEIQNRDPLPTNRDPKMCVGFIESKIFIKEGKIFLKKEEQQQSEPQRLKPFSSDICDSCKSVNSFIAYSTRQDATYYRCKKCGKTATRIKLAKS